MERSILLLISALVIGMSASAQTSGTIEGTSINWVVSDYTLEIVGNGSEAESIPTYSSQSSVPWYNYHTQINILRLSGNIKSIGKYAFYALTSMTKIYCSISTPPTLQSNTFNTSNLSSIALLVSSEEMQSSYMSAQYWMQMSISVDPDGQNAGGDPWGDPGSDPGGDPVGTVTDDTSGSLSGGQTWEITDGNTLYIAGGGDITGFSSPEEAPWYNYSSSITFLYLNADFFSIGDYVFYSLNNLATIQSPTSYKPTLSDNTFNTGSLGKHITLNIRESLKSQFEADPVWGMMNVYASISDGGNDPSAGDTYTVSWSVNGEIVSTMAVEAGNWISDLPETPSSCDGKHTFVGWTDAPIEGSQYWEPALFTNASSLPSVTGDITYYAVFSDGAKVVVDVLNRETTGVTTSTQYVDWTYTSETSGIKYVGNSAGGNDAIQLRSNNNSSGIITTMSDGMATKITIEWSEGNSGGRILSIYGSSSAFASVEDLYGSSGTFIGNIAYEDATTSVFEFPRTYPYIGIRSESGAVYLNSISITWSKTGSDGSTEYITTCSGSNQVSGVMDTGLTWSFDANVRQLTINGLGQMPDFANDYDVPWYEYIDQIESVMVNEGVTYIGNNAFYACPNLTTITFPRTTDSIGVNIFSNPNRSFTLNMGAFIPPAITSETFNNVAGQLYIYVWQSLWGLYSNTPIWENLMINSNDNPSDIEVMDVIDNQIVWYISYESLYLLGRGAMPNYTEAPDQPWYNYRSNIYKIYMNSSYITQIGSYAFEGCNLVNEVILPSKLTYVGNRAFGDCIGLVELNACAVEDEYGFACDADAFIGVDMSAVTMRVPSSTQQEAYSGTEIFSSCMFALCDSGGSGNTEDKILDSGECGPEVYWELYESGKLIIKGNSYIYGYTYYEDIPWYNYRSQINTVEVQEGVQSLTKAAFFDCVQMDSITLPASLCCIDDSTFYNCVALRTIVCTRDNPPSVNGTDPFGNVALSAITLYVPEGSGAMYSYADYWKQMQIVERGSSTSQLEPYQLEYIFVNSIGISDFNPSIYNYDITLPANSEAPRISYMSGNIDQTVEIEQPASANGTGYIHVSVDGVRMATYTLNFTSEITRAIVGLSHKWKFIMLPSMFGLNESDVTADAELQWATYDGEKRAAGQEGWNMEDIEMAYYKDWGHIVRATGDTATLTINLPANLNTTSATIQLRKHPSSHEENKNWCLIGNPYNAEYRSEGLMAAGITSSIHVWNGVGYSTFDPEFDSYAIQPFEAFFVQLPDDAPESITLSPEYIVGYNNGGNTGNDPDEGALSGYFSVGEGVQVRFSKGNLQYYPSKDIWRFAENQYDTIGIYNTNISADYDGWIDLFGWGTGANPTLASQNNEDYSTFVDWGNNAISNGGSMPGLWRTLTSDEWQYLFEGRANASQLFGYASVNGVNGLILLPDGWYDGSQPIAITTGTGDYSQNTLTIDDWSSMESAGAVFLPAAGNRWGVNVSSMGSNGFYWSSVPADDFAFQLWFTSNIFTVQDVESGTGCSIRLVR